MTLAETLLKQLENHALGCEERAQLQCQIAADFEHRGEYEAARDALAELWNGVGERPTLEGLSELTAAEVLLRVGSLSGYLGSVQQIEGAQEKAKDLISESITRFQALGETTRVAAAESELGFCYRRAGAHDDARVVYNEALKCLTDSSVATGMRPEEYLGLKWSDLDLEKGMAIVRRVLVRRKGGGWYFGEPKTSRSRRTVPLPTTLVGMLTVHRRKQIEVRLKAGAAYQNSDLVFATGEGTPHNSRNLAQRQYHAILKSANLPLNFRLYDLRHSCATLLLVAGENPKVVSERLGHASVVLTLDTYSHVLPSMQREATEKLEKMLFSR